MIMEKIRSEHHNNLATDLIYKVKKSNFSQSHFRNNVGFTIFIQIKSKTKKQQLA